MEAWNADQMREYGKARERAAYERAALECDRWHRLHTPEGGPLSVYKEGNADAEQTLAERIRALGDSNDT